MPHDTMQTHTDTYTIINEHRPIPLFLMYDKGKFPVALQIALRCPYNIPQNPNQVDCFLLYVEWMEWVVEINGAR